MKELSRNYLIFDGENKHGYPLVTYLNYGQLSLFHGEISELSLAMFNSHS
jgi:hypothetical protein